MYLFSASFRNCINNRNNRSTEQKMIDDLLKATKDERWTEASRLLYRHWVSTSQDVYPAHLERPWEASADETKIANELLYPLAAMFCAESAATAQQSEDDEKQSQQRDVSLQKLKKMVDIDEAKARSGQICGRMFRNGEPYYSCKECAIDGTCVLCYECFINSAHRNHKYKMHTSLGSGYCDCGDKEAWSCDYACKLHAPRERQEDELDTDGLPPQIATRLQQLSLITLRFAVNLLCWDQTEQLPLSIMLTEEGNVMSAEFPPTCSTFQTILFNDETHTYEGVIRALELAIACSGDQAMRLATIVDREGRAIVRTGSREICDQAKLSIENRTKKESSRRTQKTGPLLVKVFRSTVSALQLLAVRLLGWMSARAQEFPPLASIISECLLYGCPDCCDSVAPLGRARQGFLDRQCQCKDGKSIVVLLMLFDRRLWKAPRTAFHQLLMATVLKDMEHKHIFGRLLVQNYGIIFMDFIDDDHEHSVSITSMTVQIFTVPTIAKRLIIDEDALHVCLRTLHEYCQRYINVSPHNPNLRRMDFSSDSYPAVLKRALYMLNDVGYLLTVTPKEAEWTDELRENFWNGCRTFLLFLADMQEMDEVKRQFPEHQLMESEWETAFNIFLRLQEPLSLLLTWSRTDAAVHRQLFLTAWQQITNKTRLMPEFQAKRNRVQVNGQPPVPCIPFEVTRNALSVHQPLWRFIGGLFCAPDSILRHYIVDESGHPYLAEYSGELFTANTEALSQDLSKPMNLKGIGTVLMEMPMRMLVLNAQVSAAQLWRRNGFSLINQIHNYSSHLCRTEMFDRDINLLQAIGALMEPNKFLVRILDRFGLAKWADAGFEESPSTYSMDGATQEESSKIFTVIAEEMLHLLIMLLGERYTIGISDMATPQKALEREIIHILCTGPQAFSNIEKYIPNDPSMQRLSLETAVRNVGDFKRPTTMTSGQFHLKESLRNEFNPFFWHYSKHFSSLAEQQQNKERATLSREIKTCPPPVPPPFARFFAPLLRIFESEQFIKLIRVVIERIGKRSRFVSEGCFYRALFLLGMALNEQKRAHEQGVEFKFLHVAQAESIVEMLERLLDKPEVEAHNNLLWWTIKTFKHVGSLYSKTEPVETLPKEGGNPVAKTDRETNSAQRAAIAVKKRQLAMERMRQLQNSFKTQNISLIDDVNSETGAEEAAALGFDESEPATLPPDAGFPVCCGANKSRVQLRAQPMVMCVLCQENESISFDGNPIVCSGFVQSSRLFAQKCTKDDSSPEVTSISSIVGGTSSSSSVGAAGGGESLNIFSPINLPHELHVSTCSHLMHFSCYNVFIDSNNARERTRFRPHLLNARTVNNESGEFMCPLCKRLSNCVMPVFPPVQTLTMNELKGFSADRPVAVETFEEWLIFLSTLVTQPISAPKPAKGRSRKRSHSERSVADLTKRAAAAIAQQQQQSAAANSSAPVGAAVSESNVAAAASSSLPSSFDAGPPAAMAEEAADEQLQQLATSRSSSSVSSTTGGVVNDAIAGQIQAMEHNVLNEGGSAIVQQLLTYVFGTKKLTPKEINHTNVPASIPHWQTLKPLLSALEKARNHGTERDTPVVVPFFTIMPAHTVAFGRFSEMLNVLKACSFLVRSVAAVLEAEEKPLFGAFNTRQRDCLNSFVRLSQLIPFNCQPSGLRVLLSRLLSPLLAPPFFEEDNSRSKAASTSSVAAAGSSKMRKQQQPATTSPFGGVQTHQQQLDQALHSESSIMQIDMLTLAVELIFCIGWSWADGKRVLHNMASATAVYKTADGSVDELYAMRLTLLAHLFQMIQSFDPPEAPFFDDAKLKAEASLQREHEVRENEAASGGTTPGFEPMEQQQQQEDVPPSEFAAVMARLQQLHPKRRWRLTRGNELHLYKRLHSAANAFLRPLAILYNAITLVPPPESLKVPSLDNFVPLCRYLGLPTSLLELFSWREVDRLFKLWLQHYIPGNISRHLPQLPLRLNKLIELPNDFSQLINMAVNFRCPQVDEITSTVPTLCLSCGEMLCSQNYCCQKNINGKNVGACTYHLRHCNSSTGIFFRAES